MKKIYHHYLTWEDFNAGMYRHVSGKERKELLSLAIEFTGNAKLYGQFMMKVTTTWERACEQNLTDDNINQKAWIGHAACCLAIKCPEDVTRQAWGYLTEQQQIEANAKAGEAIAYWNEKQDFKLHQEMDETGIRRWNPRRSGRTVRKYEQGAIIQTDMQSHPQKRFEFSEPRIQQKENSDLYGSEKNRD